MEAVLGITCASAYLRKILWEASHKAFPCLDPVSVPIHLSPRFDRGGFSTTLPFLCGKMAGISPAAAADKLWEHLPAQDEVFTRFEKVGGYLNFAPSPFWYSRTLVWILQQQPPFSPTLTEEDLLPTDDQRIRRIGDTLVRLCSIVRHCEAENRLQLPLSFEAANTLLSPQEQFLIFCLCRLFESDEGKLLPALENVSTAFEDFWRQNRIVSPDCLQTAGRSALCLSIACQLQKSLTQLEDRLSQEIFK